MLALVSHRWRALLLAVLVGCTAVFLAPSQPARAACGWKSPWECLPGVGDSGGSSTDCKDPPAAARPDSGLAGWFLSAPNKPRSGDPFSDKPTVSTYDIYGYAGLDYATYDLGCGPDAVRNPAAVTTNTIANLIQSPAQWLVALDNSVREYAYQPDSMWGWTNSLVTKASNALRDRIFSVWGAVVLAIVGLWLLWGARGGNMSAAVTTAAWALLVMVLVSAVATWPLNAARGADGTLTGALGQVAGSLSSDNPKDKRPPAVRASGVMTQTILYNQWLRGTVGSTTSDIAKKYGPDLYVARAISWKDAKKMQESSDSRNEIYKEKANLWRTTASKVQSEDPDAYDYLTGKKGTERIGSAFLALVSALVTTPFDVMASLLILIAFLIVRLAVIFMPAIGTVGILRPASGPLRGLLRTVAAALVNCVVFGAGSAVFLLAVQIITTTESLAGWQQVLLMWLTGLILWLLLRPYRRLTQLTGVDPVGNLAGGVGRMHQRVFGDLRRISVTAAGSYLGASEALDAHDRPTARAREGGALSRPETWSRSGVITRTETITSVPGQPTSTVASSSDEPGATRRGETQRPDDSRSPAMAALTATREATSPVPVQREKRPVYRPAPSPAPRASSSVSLVAEEEQVAQRPEGFSRG